MITQPLGDLRLVPHLAFPDDERAATLKSKLGEHLGDFTTQAPNEVWLADLTYVPTGEGWLYVATVLNLFTRKIVGWRMRSTLHREIALDALQMNSGRPGLIHHSDRGIQYAAEAYRSALARAGVTPSMSRKGDAGTTPRWRASSTPSRPSGSTTGSTRPATRPARPVPVHRGLLQSPPPALTTV